MTHHYARARVYRVIRLKYVYVCVCVYVHTHPHTSNIYAQTLFQKVEHREAEDDDKVSADFLADSLHNFRCNARAVLICTTPARCVCVCVNMMCKYDVFGCCFVVSGYVCIHICVGVFVHVFIWCSHAYIHMNIPEKL